MRITIRSNLALRVLMFCAANADRLATKDEIAQTCNCSGHHLGHIINQLSHLGLLETVRGRSGGLRLARPSHEIRVGEVFRAIEAETPLAECFSDKADRCPLIEVCLLRDAIIAAAEAFYGRLDAIRLSDLVDDNAALLAIMRHARPASSICAREAPAAL